MKITSIIEKNLENVVGKLVTKEFGLKEVVGKITEYNPETGEIIFEIDEEKLKDSKWNPLAGKNIGLSSRKKNKFILK